MNPSSVSVFYAPNASASASREPSAHAVVRELLPLASAPARRRAVSTTAAAGYVGSAVITSAAVVEVARAWTTPARSMSEASNVMGGAVVALFVLAGFALATRTKELASLAVASSFVVLAHGVMVVLQGQAVGGMLVALAPVVALLTNFAFHDHQRPRSSARIDIAWAIAKSRQRTARAAARAVSRSPLAMHA